MENIQKTNLESDDNKNKDNQKEEQTKIFNNITANINKKEKEINEYKTNNNEIGISSNNSNIKNFIYKPKDNLINFQANYPLLFKY